jgi:hypothetical protein
VALDLGVNMGFRRYLESTPAIPSPRMSTPLLALGSLLAEPGSDYGTMLSTNAEDGLSMSDLRSSSLSLSTK